jgi:cell cycle sensor histidine kinase DivJ
MAIGRAYGVNLAHPVRDRLETVRSSMRINALHMMRHHAFAAPRVAWGVAALSALPFYLFAWGPPGAHHVALICWFAAPIAASYIMLRTRRQEVASLFSAAALIALALSVYALGAGAAYASLWLALAIVEGAFAGYHRVKLIALACAVAAGIILVLAPAAGPLSASQNAAGVAAALSYAAMLALCSAWTAADSSHRKNADEGHYDLLARHMSDVISRVRRNGVVTFISPAAERILGVPTRELMGHGLFDRIHVADRPAWLKAISDVAETRHPCSVEFRIRCHTEVDGRSARQEFLWLEMRCSALDVRDARSGQQDVVAVLRDVGSRKSQQQAVESARAEAERANAAKTHFLATMSHELRTPLNAVIGFSEILCQEQAIPVDAARRFEYARLIHDSGCHLLSVVNLVLDMSKIESGNFEITPEPFLPTSVLRSCCDLLALKAAESGLDLVAHVQEGLPEITADKRALKQILLNILTNAVKFTPRGGCVILSAKATDSELIITVEDSGIGISVADLKRVGDPFFQVRDSYDRPYDGTGLGLSIVKGLLALHGGKLDIASALGKGTHVTIRLPLNCERAITAAGAMSDGVSVTNIETLSKAEKRDAVANQQVRKRA